MGTPLFDFAAKINKVCGYMRQQHVVSRLA